MNKQELQLQALKNAVHNTSLMNYGPIISGFAERGIPVAEILPRENVFTFNAWKALGRVVRKGEKGIQVTSFVACKAKQKDNEATEGDGNAAKTFRRPRSTYVFHISQTEPLN